MQRFLILAACALAGFFDFSIGCLITVVAGMAMDVTVLWWYLPIGGILALLPDFDILEPITRQFLTGKLMTGNHRETTVLHRPLPILLMVIVFGFVLGGTYWAITAFLCVFAHYVHDARETGSDGLAWFWPFSHKYWWVGGSYEPRYLEAESWLKSTWLRPSKRSVVELCIGTAALCAAISVVTHNILYGMMFAPFLWVETFSIWYVWDTLEE